MPRNADMSSVPLMSFHKNIVNKIKKISKNLFINSVKWCIMVVINENAAINYGSGMRIGCNLHNLH